MIGIVPAAGRGTRLGSLTADTPKALVPVADRPVIERVIEAVLDTGVEVIVVVVGHLGDQVVDRVRRTMPEADIRFVHQEIRDGNVGALLAAEGHAGGGPFLYAWADLVTSRWAVASLVEGFDGSHSVLGVDRSTDPRRGAAVTVGDGRVVSIVEKPAPGSFDTPYNASGLGVLHREAWSFLHDVEPSERGERELTTALSNMVEDGCEIEAIDLGVVLDIGTPEGLRRAERWVRENESDHPAG